MQQLKQGCQREATDQRTANTAMRSRFQSLKGDAGKVKMKNKTALK